MYMPREVDFLTSPRSTNTVLSGGLKSKVSRDQNTSNELTEDVVMTEESVAKRQKLQ